MAAPRKKSSFRSGIKHAHLQKRTVAMNEALVLGSVRQHELTDAAERLNAELQAEIAQRKQVEAALRTAQAQLANRALQLEGLVTQRTAKLQETIGELEGFSYSITHDLRAPLRAMSSFSQMLEQGYGGKLDDAGKDLLRRIRESANRMDKLIQDVLQYSQVLRVDLRLERVDADKLLRGILESYQDFQEPQAEVTIEGELPAVLGNEAALTQCFSNLLNNAVKFVAPGVKPRVRIGVEAGGDAPRAPSDEQTSGTPAVTRPPSNPMIRLWFVDNGVGIAAPYLAKIFEMFQRLETTFEGTGIGLTIVRKAIERMGGRVGVESEPGKGSRFWLELKAANPTAKINEHPDNPLR